MVDYQLLASGTANQNYRYLRVQGATHETASAIVKERFSNVVQIKQFSPYLEPAQRKPMLPTLPKLEQLTKVEGIPSITRIWSGKVIVKVASFETGKGVYVSRLGLCRALGKYDSFLSRLPPTASHAMKLAERGYSNSFRLVKDTVNGGQPLRCISLNDAQLAAEVLAGQGVSNAA